MESSSNLYLLVLQYFSCLFILNLYTFILSLFCSYFSTEKKSNCNSKRMDLLNLFYHSTYFSFLSTLLSGLLA